MRRTIGKVAVAAGFLCSMAFGDFSPVAAQGYYYGGGPYGPYRPGPYGRYGPGPYERYGRHHQGNPYDNPPGLTCSNLGCCPRGFTVQDGVCRPYRGY